MKKALVAMSGGVDSAVAAKLILDMGFDSIGCTMQLLDSYNLDNQSLKTCCSLDDVEDARAVAYKLGIPYYVFNLKDSFKKYVIDSFVQSYINGSTPNPCINCNKYLKFEKLFTRAEILDCDYVVTGHYARIEKSNNRYLLKKAIDQNKDQSYVLYNMTQQQLARTLFPLGAYTKKQIREIAKKNGFSNAEKPDSQDICFVPNGNYAQFVESYSGVKSAPGNFVDTAGNKLGTHKGIIHYTLGQRKGLGLSFDKRMYVCEIHKDNNTVVLGSNEALYKKHVSVKNFNWISGEAPRNKINCKVKLRYRQTEQDAVVTPVSDSCIEITFKHEQRAATPGQSAVLYDDDVVLGGGIIV